MSDGSVATVELPRCDTTRLQAVAPALPRGLKVATAPIRKGIVARNSPGNLSRTEDRNGYGRNREPSSAPWPFRENKKADPAKCQGGLKRGFEDQVDSRLDLSHSSIVWIFDHRVPAGIQSQVHVTAGVEQQHASEGKW